MLRDFNCKGNGGKKIEKFNEEPHCDRAGLYHPFAGDLFRAYPDVQQCAEIKGAAGPCEHGDTQGRPDHGEDADNGGNRRV